MNRRHFTALIVSAAGLVARRGWAVDEIVETAPSHGKLNAPLPTMGGRQFWGDELFFHGWHIQRNTLTGHYRLLDRRNVRHAWGTFEECDAKLAHIRQRENLPPMRGPAVIVLHGLGRSAASMAPMANFLRDTGKYTVFNVTYPTTRGTIGEHADQLNRIIDRLDGIDEIYFVSHSLGGLVIRHYLADHSNPLTGEQPDARLRRIVMLGPPNNGARLAEVFGGNGMFDALLGKAAGQIRDFKDNAGRLATPECDFGIIAGGKGAAQGYNPWLAGDNDLVVSVETTKLPGAKDFAVLPVVHTLMMDNPTVQQYTEQFFTSGYFTSAEARNPIPA